MEDTAERPEGSNRTRSGKSRKLPRVDEVERAPLTMDPEDQSKPEANQEEVQRVAGEMPEYPLARQIAKDLKLKMPEFKGKKGRDPQVHLQAFESWASFRELPRSEWRVCFPQTLRGAAQTWYFNYPPEQLPSYKSLSRAFTQRFKDERTEEELLSQLGKIKQKKANVRQFVEEIKDLARQLSSPPANKSLRAWFLNGTSLKGMAKAEITNPTKTFDDLIQRAMKMERKRVRKSKKETSSSESSDSEDTSSSEEEPAAKKTKTRHWEEELKQLKSKIQELSGIRTKMPGKREVWCVHCRVVDHSTDQCIKCDYCERRGHDWEECPIRLSTPAQ